MTYKTVLVHAQEDPAEDGRVELALSVARLFGATALGIAAETWYPIGVLPEYGYVPGEIIEGLERESLIRLDAAQHRFRELARSAEIPAMWGSELDYPRDALTRHARAADLIVVSRPAAPYAESRVVRPADLVTAAGLPVLIKADARAAISAEHVVVGWKNTRESRRAVSEAMPFLKRASGVTLAQVAHDADLEGARFDLEATAGRLSRQGVSVSIEAIPARAHVCEALESLAARRGADLIVVGAYGHSRLRETVFGGVTQGFLERGSAHVLFSH